MVNYLILFLICGLLSLFLTPFFRSLAIHRRVFDIPDERKVHKKPIPRWGGFPIFIAFNLGLLFASRFEFFYLPANFLERIHYNLIFAGSLVAMGLGAIDDIRPIPISIKFLFQIVAGLFVVLALPGIRTISLPFGTIHLGPWSSLITILWVVGITNAINLLDGLDGLAGGASFIAAVSLAAIFYFQQNMTFVMISVIFAGSVLGFLRYNFHPASIFLGDSGAYYLGYLLAVFSLVGGNRGPTTIAILIPILALGLPIIDTLLSMTRRLLKSLHIMTLDEQSNKIKLFYIEGRSMFKADRDHIHHRLLEIGFTHRKVVILIYGICVVFGSLAFFTVYLKNINIGLLMTAVAIATYLGIRRLGYSEMEILSKGVLLPVFDIPFINQRFLRVFIDIALIILAYYFSLFLRYEGLLAGELRHYFISTFPVVLTVRMAVFYLSGLYNGVWRYTNIGDLIKIGKAVFLGCIVTAFALWLIPGFGIKSWSALIIEFNLLFISILGVRSSYRFLEYLYKSKQKTGRRTLIYGAGRKGTLALREFIHDSGLGITPVGFVDDDPGMKSKSINGYPVLSDLNRLNTVLEADSISEIVISTDDISRERMDRLVEICRKSKVGLRRFDMRIEGIFPQPKAET